MITVVEDVEVEKQTVFQVLDKAVRELRDLGHGRRTIELICRDGKIVHADVITKESIAIRDE